MQKLKNQTIEKTYKGRKIKVIIKDGKVFLGNTKKRAFRSLSGAATHITKHATSGLYFFGLVDYRTKPEAKGKLVKAVLETKPGKVRPVLAGAHGTD